jgi:imidazolonepropionase-like amidohydrolase
LVGATLIDGTGAPAQPNTTLLIRDGTIAAMGADGSLAFSADTPRRNLAGLTVLPGFVNTHAHSHTLSDAELAGWARAGVTTVRDLQGPRDAMLARAATLRAANDPSMPRLLVAGPMITVPGGHPIPVYGMSDQIVAVRGPDDARAQASALLDAGADVLKIAVSGRTDVSWPELSDAEIQAITAVAAARGARVAAHVDRAAGLRRAVANGITDAAHMPRDRMPDELIAQMVARGVAMSPTIAVYEGLAAERGNLSEWRRTVLPVMYDNLRRFVAAGGQLTLGDDYGNPGIALGMPMAELRHWIAAGLSPMQAIVASTSAAAAACGLSNTIGTLRPGMVADLFAVAGDPLADIGALEQVRLVVHNGIIVREE